MLKIFRPFNAIPLLLLFPLLFNTSDAVAQTVVHSTNGYDVNITIVPIALVIHTNPCTWGYNYDVQMSYTVTFTGSNPPPSMYTLQGTVGCGSSSMFFNLPNGPSSGTVTSGGNAWRGVADCATASLASLGCSEINIQINGPGISNRTLVIPATTLPITLVGFDAEGRNDGVHLDWTTASEQDNAYFTVESSVDAITFAPVLQLAGAGNSSEMLSYSTIDRAPLPGLSYYRLRQTDINGTSSISLAVVVKSRMQASSFQVYPNPSDSPSIELPETAVGGELEILSLNGQVVYSGPVHSRSLRVPALESGTYLLSLSDPITGMRQHCRWVRL